jgi:ABC-type antimicrobial peptide transport system permease subunit
VVEDVKYTAATRPVRPMIFLPAFQNVDYGDSTNANVQSRSMLLRTFIARIDRGARGLEHGFRQALAQVDPDLTVIRVLTLDEQVSANYRIQRLMARLTSFYGLLALGLACLGLYGVTAYSVTRRTREIGVRMALGADRSRVVATMLAGPVAQMLIGLGIGLPVTLACTRLIESQLYGVEARDPATLVLTVMVLFVTGAAAAALAAFRAARVDPIRALRTE